MKKIVILSVSSLFSLFLFIAAVSEAVAGGNDIEFDPSIGQAAFDDLSQEVGLPFGIDVGAVFSTVPGSNITLYGGEIKYAVLKGSIVSPAVALRGTYTTLSGVDDLDASTYSLDASVSKGVGPLTPYGGIGQVWINTEENAGLGLDDVSTSATKLFVGTKLKILLVSIALQADFSDVNMYSARANISF